MFHFYPSDGGAIFLSTTASLEPLPPTHTRTYHHSSGIKTGTKTPNLPIRPAPCKRPNQYQPYFFGDQTTCLLRRTWYNFYVNPHPFRHPPDVSPVRPERQDVYHQTQAPGSNQSVGRGHGESTSTRTCHGNAVRVRPNPPGIFDAFPHAPSVIPATPSTDTTRLPIAKESHIPGSAYDREHQRIVTS